MKAMYFFLQCTLPSYPHELPKKAFILLFKCTSQVIEHVSQDHRILQLIHAYQISFLKAPN